MEQPLVLEGTWEEIKQHDAELSGLWLKVIVESGIGRHNGTTGGTQAQIQDKEDKIGHENEIQDKSPRQLRGLGMFAYVPGGSEAFAREKQDEIAREDAPVS